MTKTIVKKPMESLEAVNQRTGNTMAKKRTDNDLQNTKQKTKDRAT